MTIACSRTHSRAGEETTGVLVCVREFEPSSVNLKRDANAKIGDVVKGRHRRMLGRRCIDRFFHARAFEKFTRRALLGRLFEYRQRLIADVETNDELTRRVEFVHDVAVSDGHHLGAKLKDVFATCDVFSRRFGDERHSIL